MEERFRIPIRKMVLPEEEGEDLKPLAVLEVVKQVEDLKVLIALGVREDLKALIALGETGPLKAELAQKRQEVGVHQAVVLLVKGH